tara:strand:+ start:514 stop:1587 length:1074 start_codon:yes stop_codon:yes gene_type:complete
MEVFMMLEVKPSKALSLMLDTIKAGHVPMLLGGTGVGKSEIVLEVAEMLSGDRQLSFDNIRPTAKQFGFIDMRLSILETIDLSGLPLITEDGEQRRAFLGNLPISGDGVLFLDEFAQSNTSMQSVAGQLIKERRLGEYILPEGWHIVMAGNRSTDRSGANKIVAHAMDRVQPIHFIHDTDDWLSWGFENGVDQKILSFIKYMPQYLWTFDPKLIESQPSPRSWTRLSDILKVSEDDELLQYHAYSSVGEVASLEFLNFISLFQDIPNLDVIFEGGGAGIPDGVGLQYATCVGLSTSFQGMDSKKTTRYFENALRYVQSFPTPEFSMFFSRAVVGCRPELKETKAYVDFRIAHHDLMV